MFDVHIQMTCYTNVDFESEEYSGEVVYEENVFCQPDEVHQQLQVIGEALMDPNAEFNMTDEVIIVIHLEPNDE